jgi:3D (Asp-Asp-Asp) domain-containing protein
MLEKPSSCVVHLNHSMFDEYQNASQIRTRFRHSMLAINPKIRKNGHHKWVQPDPLHQIPRHMQSKSRWILMSGLALAALGLASCESASSSSSSASMLRSGYKSLAASGGDRSNTRTAKWDGTIKATKIVRTTAYHAKESDHIIYGDKSAYGTPLRYGKVRSAAADWSRYPVGTVFRIRGLPYLYIIDDYGSALVGKDTIDLYKSGAREMNWWGVRHVKIDILRWGSFDLSHQILAKRVQHPHCKKMADSISARRPWLARNQSDSSRPRS